LKQLALKDGRCAWQRCAWRSGDARVIRR